MRTYLITYDLAAPEFAQPLIAKQIMQIGQTWARPLETAWLVRTELEQAELERKLGPYFDEDDALIILAVESGVGLVNTSVRWFPRRTRPSRPSGPRNVVTFPYLAAATAKPARNDAPHSLVMVPKQGNSRSA
ncbi:MAG: hypothetical protein KDJ41_20270 [Hyphomicrobiaceae bacterium]|nr:hypothetical protein [Hyphomicrobiaceae bacterium]